MNQEIIKPGIVRKIVDKLKDKKIIVGGNKEVYKRLYKIKYSKEIVNDVLSAYLEVLEDIIEEGDGIRLNGYMAMKPIHFNSRYARNVYTNEEIVVPEKYRVKVSIGNRLVDACNRYNDKVKKEVSDESDK